MENYNLLVTAKLRASQFNAGMKSMDTRIRAFSGSITGLQGALIALPFAAVGVAAVKAASDLESAERRFKISFGNLQDYGNEFQEGITDALGRTRGEILTSMVSFKQFFQGLGFATSSAAMLSKKMAGLSIDLAAFFNISDQQASKRFLAALAGSPEVLDQFGINLKEAAVKQELLNMGIKGGVQRASEFQKTIARLNIIDRVMGKNGLVGFAINNTDLFANRLKELQGRVKGLAISFGKELLPIASKAVSKLAGFAKTLTEMSQIDKQRIIGLVVAISALPLALSALASATTVLTGFIAVLGGSTATIIASAAAFWLLSDAIENYNKLTFISDEEKQILDKLEGTNAAEKIAAINRELQKLEKGSGKEKGFFEALGDAALIDLGIGNDTIRYAERLKSLKMSLEAAGDEFLNTKTSSEAMQEALGQTFTNVIEKAKDKFNDLSNAIGESIFGGNDAKKIDPKDLIPLDAKGIEEASESLTSGIVDAAGKAMIKVGQQLPEITKKITEFKGTKIIYDAGRRLGMAFGDGIVVGLDDVKSLIEGFRDILTSSITGVFESLGSFAVDKSSNDLKNNLLGLLGSAFTAVGSAIIAFGTAMLNFQASAATLNPFGVIAAGGAMVALGSAISTVAGREFGGKTGTAASAQFTGSQLTGQTSFGQVLTAEVDYDKLRFVLNNGQSSSFRSNG